MTGLFRTRELAIEDRISDYDNRIEQMERRLETFELNLVLRFARLEEAMGLLNAQGDALTSALASLTNNN